MPWGGRALRLRECPDDIRREGLLDLGSVQMQWGGRALRLMLCPGGMGKGFLRLRECPDDKEGS